MQCSGDFYFFGTPWLPLRVPCTVFPGLVYSWGKFWEGDSMMVWLDTIYFKGQMSHGELSRQAFYCACLWSWACGWQPQECPSHWQNRSIAGGGLWCSIKIPHWCSKQASLSQAWRLSYRCMQAWLQGIGLLFMCMADRSIKLALNSVYSIDC